MIKKYNKNYILISMYITFLLLFFSISLILLTACSHKHKTDTNWSYDDNGHWLECEDCSETLARGEHVYDINGICMVCSMARPEDGELEYILSEDGGSYIVSGIGTLRGKNVSIPALYNGKPVAKVGDYAFAGTDITGVSVAGSVTEIGHGAFWNCRYLTSVTLADSVKIIGDSAFDACVSLTEVSLGNGIEVIGKWAFSRCVSLKKIDFSSGISEIGDYAFYGCRTASEFFLPDSVRSIGIGAFEGCGELNTVKLGNGVSTIRERTFAGCKKLTSITLGISVADIGENAFEDCRWLVEIFNFSGIVLIKGDAYSNGAVAMHALDIYTSDEESKITQTGDGYVFYKSGDDVFLLGYKGFENELTLPESFEGKSYSIYAYAFSGYGELLSVRLSDGVISVGEYAFPGCERLKNVTVGRGINVLGRGMFSGCTALASVTFEGNTEYIREFAFSDCISLVSIELPDSVVGIYGNAFENCRNLVGVKLGRSLKTLGMGAFSNCESLVEITIPYDAVMIEKWAFRGCTSLERVVFENLGDWIYVADPSFEHGRRLEVESPDINALNLTYKLNDFYFKRSFQ